AGCLNTGCSLVVYCLGILVGLNYAVANAIAWVAGVVVGFLLASRFVFRKPYGLLRFLGYAGSNVLGLVVGTASLTLLIKVFGMGAILASVASIPIIVAVGYLTANFAVFR